MQLEYKETMISDEVESKLSNQPLTPEYIKTKACA